MGGLVTALAAVSAVFGTGARWVAVWHLSGFLAGFVLAYVPAVAGLAGERAG
jgi:hypothetical protein